MSSRDLARRDIKTATKIQITIAAILLILSVVLIAGTTFARYESKNTSELTMDIQQSNQLFLLSGDTSESEEYDALSEWTRFSANEYVIDFLLANGNSNDNVCSYAQNAYLEMVVTAGAEKTEHPNSSYSGI